jgi:antitoxin component YwqK of YwqJK toxin-antitoxin module
MGICQTRTEWEYTGALGNIKRKKYYVDRFGNVDINKPVTTYHVNRVIHEIYYVDERENKNGTYECRYDNAKICMKGEYKNGKEEGKITMYYNNGNKRYEYFCKDGKICGKLCRWHDNGQKEEEIDYDRGLRHGMHKSWDTDGTKRVELNYKNNSIQGEQKVWENNLLKKWYFNYEDEHVIYIRFCLKGWKVFNQLIINKKRRMLVSKMLKVKNQLYQLQGDNVIYKVIIEYLTNEEIIQVLNQITSKS